MKKIYLLLVFLLLIVEANAQKGFTKPHHTLWEKQAKVKPIVCPLKSGDANTTIAPPEAYLAYARQLKAGARVEAKSTFSVSYSGFTPQAQQAFQAAVDIWQTLLSSPTPIRIQATWTKLDKNILGSAGPSTFEYNFNGALQANTMYPMALAEKIARTDLNSKTNADISASFNSTGVPWFYNTGTTIQKGQYDLTTVVLHELCHGLGFYSSIGADTTSQRGGYGISVNGSAALPTPLDYFIVNAQGKKLLNATTPKELYLQIISDSIYFNSPTALANNGGIKIRAYAPNPYEEGSSISHLDEDTYPAGNVNSLMTPAAASAEVIKNPGPITLGLFEDIGWKTTSVLHDNLKDTEDLNKTIVFNADIFSDTTLVESSFKVVYTETANDTTFAKQIVLPLTKVAATTNSYTASIPATGKAHTVLYYISATDIANRTYTSPPQALPNYWGFKIGTDTTPPLLQYIPNGDDYPVTLASSKDTINVVAFAYDKLDLGIDSVYVQYTLNGTAKPKIKIPSRNDLLQDAYYLQMAFGTLKNGDIIKYQVVAIDKAKARNKTLLPADGSFYTLMIVDPKTTAQEIYINNFNATTSDFAGAGFSIKTETGFTDGAIHSDHPYTNGSENVGYETNRYMILLQPIKLRSADGKMKFDEIVLAEPSESGSTFASSGFYDYVIVEGSKDGVNWIPFQDGYNCTSSSYTDWLKAWNSNLVTDTKNSTVAQPVKDSRALGTPSLYHSRTINMLSSGDFVSGDNILIRFRLFSDQLVNGWGWAIDNLQIQPSLITAIAPLVEEKLELTISPNPSPDLLQIKTTLKQVGKVQVDVINTLGTKMMQQNYIADTQNFNQNLDLKNLPSGTYFIRLFSNNTILMKKFIVAK